MGSLAAEQNTQTNSRTLQADAAMQTATTHLPSKWLVVYSVGGFRAFNYEAARCTIPVMHQCLKLDVLDRWDLPHLPCPLLANDTLAAVTRSTGSCDSTVGRPAVRWHEVTVLRSKAGFKGPLFESSAPGLHCATSTPKLAANSSLVLTHCA